jgi:chromosome segregation ATPase
MTKNEQRAVDAMNPAWEALDRLTQRITEDANHIEYLEDQVRSLQAALAKREAHLVTYTEISERVGDLVHLVNECRAALATMDDELTTASIDPLDLPEHIRALAEIARIASHLP